MNVFDFIDRALLVPYAEGRGDWAGADCWGIVELYYEHVLNIDLDDRGNIQPGHDGLQAGFDKAEHWPQIEKPEDHCLVIMQAKHLLAGHVGVFHNGYVLHSWNKDIGCVFQPITDRFIRSRITAYLRYQ